MNNFKLEKKNVPVELGDEILKKVSAVIIVSMFKAAAMGWRLWKCLMHQWILGDNIWKTKNCMN